MFFVSVLHIILDDIFQKRLTDLNSSQPPLLINLIIHRKCPIQGQIYTYSDRGLAVRCRAKLPFASLGKGLDSDDIIDDWSRIFNSEQHLDACTPTTDSALSLASPDQRGQLHAFPFPSRWQISLEQFQKMKRNNNKPSDIGKRVRLKTKQEKSSSAVMDKRGRIFRTHRSSRWWREDWGELLAPFPWLPFIVDLQNSLIVGRIQ